MNCHQAMSPLPHPARRPSWIDLRSGKSWHVFTVPFHGMCCPPILPHKSLPLLEWIFRSRGRVLGTMSPRKTHHPWRALFLGHGGIHRASRPSTSLHSSCIDALFKSAVWSTLPHSYRKVCVVILFVANWLSRKSLEPGIATTFSYFDHVVFCTSSAEFCLSSWPEFWWSKPFSSAR